jgi:Protein of unknown function (DUF3667)
MRLPGQRQEHPETLSRDPLCLNCHTPVAGLNFCPNCGQENFNYRTRLGKLVAFWWDRNVSIDGKFIRSLWVLLVRPGELTVAYLAGQRARYTPPGQLYFLIALVYFFLLSSAVRTGVTYGNSTSTRVNSAPRPVLTDTGNSKGLLFGHQDTSAPMVQADFSSESVPDSLASLTRDSLAARIIKIGGWSSSERDLKNAFVSADSIHTIKRVLNEQLEALTLISVPLFALALLIFYRRTHRYFIDHLVMALHFYTAAFFLAIPLFLLGSSVSNAAPTLGMTAVLVIYFGLSIHRVYRPSVVTTVVHCLVLSFYSFILFSILLIVVWMGNLALDIGVLKFAPSMWSLINGAT